MPYVDGFVMPVKKARIAEYRRIARKAGKVWREHGALDYVECVADDVPKGKLTGFDLALKLKRDEIPVFSWIVYKTKSQRDRVNRKAMDDPRLAEFKDPKGLPFDPKRMFWGGFKQLVRL